ncbi:MAG: hypothetical protein NT159_20490 [Proteobacteria bacterium]|nr:hypothetical protein [Pseudomonadota bacterium]
MENELDDAVLRRLLRESGRNFAIDRTILGRGFGMLKSNVPKCKAASKAFPHVVLTDLDRHVCPSALLTDWKATRLPKSMLLRIAVKEVEAWLLADREGIADFLKVPRVKVPANPETIADPKQALVNLARRSRSSRLAQEIVPAPGSSAPIGPMYNRHLSNFATTEWDVASARNNSVSLDRALNRFAHFMSAAH